MADHLREEMGKMLDQYDERRRSVLEQEQKVRVSDALFLTQFAELRRTVVRPVFEAAGAMLAERGHAFEISEEEVSSGSRGGQAGARRARRESRSASCLRAARRPCTTTMRSRFPSPRATTPRRSGSTPGPATRAGWRARKALIRWSGSTGSSSM